MWITYGPFTRQITLNTTGESDKKRNKTSAYTHKTNDQFAAAHLRLHAQHRHVDFAIL